MKHKKIKKEDKGIFPFFSVFLILLYGNILKDLSIPEKKIMNISFFHITISSLQVVQ